MVRWPWTALHAQTFLVTPAGSDQVSPDNSCLVPFTGALTSELPRSHRPLLSLRKHLPVRPLVLQPFPSTMHALWPRINQLSTHLVTMLSTLVIVGSILSYIQTTSASPQISLALASPPTLKRLPRERCDQSMLHFDLVADLRPVWSWNVKHLYVSVVAEYESTSHGRNEVVVWDDIISSKAEADVIRKKQWNKYSLKDWGYGLKGRDIKLLFKYSVMPYMGVLMYGERPGVSFSMPEDYSGVNKGY